ncbi:16S rRNA (cytosine(1402)-N(4))-methyltransferase RsmH [Calderihabitans maritimus]|uniref:Ribosomal RNA small subunit methyltransferase H n=1 Tax=Calderihabitans maritimus TaxID=1246530 RepID=A0A1Z5HRJ8_9FIRM|nr:16S rRNA (cytosine(1402)-N(4))-methyltransferase RsmH [Calderihabitans maritimus]GAW92152.1 S-adenosyl-methyltransferase MraW [Calderihabitans maritimus]
MVAFEHIPVMLEETIELLAIKPEGIYVDCTLGGGGHSRAILDKLGKQGRLIAIDQDMEAIEAFKPYKQGFGDRVSLVHGNFVALKDILQQMGVKKVDGILFDIGVSSHQLDTPERGFSYQLDAPLDMRMDTTRELTAWHIVNNYSEADLARIIYEYGEERWARRIASFIVQARKKKPIDTSGQLVEVIKRAIPAGARKVGPHPAKRTFQALRIAVNNELEVLEKALYHAVEVLKPSGRVCVISFHSLEDRIVKKVFRQLSRACTCPPEQPICVCKSRKIVKVITKKPVTPSQEEVKRNPRSRSAKLRAAEKL